MHTTPPAVQAAIAARTAAGLRLAFILPDRAEPFVCYPRDEAEKQHWLATAASRGWTAAQ